MNIRDEVKRLTTNAVMKRFGKLVSVEVMDQFFKQEVGINIHSTTTKNLEDAKKKLEKWLNGENKVSYSEEDK